ncbi:hypothetical protein [Promicromonospora soli]|uniref:Uncharacterized protein n=1 Tax=Promicromonospora soli TaxID=2035533 RepID=A0A919G8J2_9MICO|nr:hypothetical protein [Promicromonospora soli]GHH80087.1 hypothetical protein GCM10017772_47400 [Promicromonospora soli]
MTDEMKQLKAADPMRRVALDAVDPAAFAALREEITMTGTQLDTAATEREAAGATPPGSRRRRLGRRGAIAVALAGVLAGGGVAYAAIQAYLGEGTEGLTCMTTWNDRALEGLDVDAAGPWLTGDAVADCTTLLAEAGLPPVGDPVVFEHDGQVYVTPTDQAPDWIEPIDSGSGPAVDAAAIELRQSLGDQVDGGNSTCRTLDEGVAWAQSELDRLGLEGWTIETVGTASAERPCTGLSAEEDQTLVVAASEDPAALYSVAELEPLMDSLRRDVAEQCVTVEQARAVADEALGALPHSWPTTTVVDESAECARVDSTVGGSVQVTVYGPTTVG